MPGAEKWLPRVAAVLLTASTMTASTMTAAEPPADPNPIPTTSHYMVLGADPTAADQTGYRVGCEDGRDSAAGPRVLFFGTQEAGGRLRPPGTKASSPAARFGEDTVERAAGGWLRGFAECGRSTGVLALGVNNKSDGGIDGAAAGVAWAALVDRVAATAPADRVVVDGALDGEPSWSGPDWARGWVNAYTTRTGRTLYAANSADGCPSGDPRAAELGESCSNGWTVRDVQHVSTGAAPSVLALPQIYRTDGIQARQWAWISQWGVRAGLGPLRIAGALSQQTACRQKSGCSGTDNPPVNARSQLFDALAANPGTRANAPLVASDMAWSDGSGRRALKER